MHLSLISLALAACASASVHQRRQVPGDTVTLAERAAFFCPPGIDGTLALDRGQEAGLRFCSRVDRWSPNTLYSSQPVNAGSGNYRAAASRCASLCTGICQTFSVAPSTPGNATFGCNLYNATVPFRGNTNGGLFYARQAIAGALPSTSTILREVTQTTCPTSPAAQSHAIVITGPTSAPSAYPVVYHPANQPPTTVTAPEQVVTRTALEVTTITKTLDGHTTAVVESIAKESAAPFIVFIQQVGEVKVTKIVNNIVVILVVQVNGDIENPVQTSTVTAAPSATANSFQCPAGIVAQYQDTTNAESVFNLRFCSNTQRWSPVDLYSTTPVPDSSYAAAAQICSRRCNASTCETFSVAPTAVGGTTFNCNLYNATNVFNGPTNGGLFYQRQNSPYSQEVPQCVGSLRAITSAGTLFSRQFCSRTERWSPATLFDGTVQTGQSRAGVAPIVEAAQKCAGRCASFGARCMTFSTTFTEQNPPTSDAAVPVNFNCNLYNATVRVAGMTQGGAFYQSVSAQLPYTNGTVVAKRFAS